MRANSFLGTNVLLNQIPFKYGGGGVYLNLYVHIMCLNVCLK